MVKGAANTELGGGGRNPRCHMGLLSLSTSIEERNTQKKNARTVIGRGATNDRTEEGGKGHFPTKNLIKQQRSRK